MLKNSVVTAGRLIALLILAICASEPSYAGTVTVAWVAPSQNVDGSQAQVVNYRLSWSGTRAGAVLTGNVQSYALDLAPGTYSITLTALDAASESDPTNPAIVTVAGPQVTDVLGSWTLKKGSSNLQTGIADYQACKDLAAGKAVGKYFCAVSNAVTVK